MLALRQSRTWHQPSRTIMEASSCKRLRAKKGQKGQQRMSAASIVQHFLHTPQLQQTPTNFKRGKGKGLAERKKNPTKSKNKITMFGWYVRCTCFLSEGLSEEEGKTECLSQSCQKSLQDRKACLCLVDRFCPHDLLLQVRLSPLFFLFLWFQSVCKSQMT